MGLFLFWRHNRLYMLVTKSCNDANQSVTSNQEKTHAPYCKDLFKRKKKNWGGQLGAFENCHCIFSVRTVLGVLNRSTQSRMLLPVNYELILDHVSSSVSSLLNLPKGVFTWYRGDFHPGASSLRFPLMALYSFTWYQSKMSCRRESYRREFTPVLVPERDFHPGTKIHSGVM